MNSCQTSGFSKVRAIIKYNIMHFPVLIKTVLKLVYVAAELATSRKKEKYAAIDGHYTFEAVAN